ncbi:MAG: hypothetical protein ACRD2R_05345 [Terriglobales bacterium]
MRPSHSGNAAQAKRRTPALALAALAVLGTVAAGWAEDATPSLPRIYHARTYPAHEAHEMEKFIVAADPYDLPEKTARLVISYKKEGLMPVQLILSNEGKRAVSLVAMKVTLVTVDRIKIEPSSPDDIYRRIARQKRRGDEPARNPFPVPLPRKKLPASVKKEAVEEVERLRFLAKAVEPESTKGGFLFFDVEGISNPLAGAHLYVSGLRNDDGQELFFFEIPMEKYLGYTPISK